MLIEAETGPQGPLDSRTQEVLCLFHVWFLQDKRSVYQVQEREASLSVSPPSFPALPLLLH